MLSGQAGGRPTIKSLCSMPRTPSAAIPVEKMILPGSVNLIIPGVGFMFVLFIKNTHLTQIGIK
jgi:hypothetical protein